jgi:hypothetical protein
VDGKWRRKEEGEKAEGSEENGVEGGNRSKGIER